MVQVSDPAPADAGVGAVANLLATLPIALVRRRLPAAAARSSSASSSPSRATIRSHALRSRRSSRLAAVAFLVAAALRAPLVGRCSRRRSSLNAIAPFSGHDVGRSPAVLLLVVVVAALALGDARRQRGAGGRRARRGAARPGADGGARAHRPRAARHRRPPRVDDRRPGRDRPPDDAGPARGGQAAIRSDRTRPRATRSRELRRLLGVLREDAGGGGRARPQPGLADLEALRRRRARGRARRCASTVTDAPARSPPAVDLTAYRIVQEALTNARRHAPGRRRRRRASLRGRARSTSRCATTGPARRTRRRDGHGLVGMRERVGDGRRHARGRPGAGRRLRRARRASDRSGDDVSIRVVVADDQEIVRAASPRCSPRSPTWQVAGTAADGEEAVPRLPRGASRRRADGRPHARPRRHRGHAPAHERRRGRASSADADHVRPRRVRLRRARRRRQRLPAQGRHRASSLFEAVRVVAAGRRAARPGGHAPADRRVRPAAAAAADRTRRACAS